MRARAVREPVVGGPPRGARRAPLAEDGHLCRAPDGALAEVDGGGHRPDDPGEGLEGEPGHGLQVPATVPWG